MPPDSRYQLRKYNLDLLELYSLYFLDESTTDADASVEMPKLHNMKLLIAFILMNIFTFAACKLKRVGNDRPWLLLKTINAKSSSLKLMAAINSAWRI